MKSSQEEHEPAAPVPLLYFHTPVPVTLRAYSRISPWVGFAKSPFSLSLRHMSHAFDPSCFSSYNKRKEVSRTSHQGEINETP